jgi:hypothetical protein
MAPEELLPLKDDFVDSAEPTVMMRWLMLTPVSSKASPSSAKSESLADFENEPENEGDIITASEPPSSWLLPLEDRDALLELISALRHVSASTSLLHLSRSSRSTVRTLMQ